MSIGIFSIVGTDIEVIVEKIGVDKIVDVGFWNVVFVEKSDNIEDIVF